MSSFLEPGSHRVACLVDDDAVLAALVRTEVAWLIALARAGLVDEARVQALGIVAPKGLAPADVEAAGNPVLTLVEDLRGAIGDPEVAALLHRGLTSQDTLDTALMLVSAGVADSTMQALDLVAIELARLAGTHRNSVMVGRTLTKYAVPVTFGLRAAQWLVGVLEARDGLRSMRTALPVQCGGAAGTLSLAGELVDDPTALATMFAEELGLQWPGLPWHVRRTPVTSLGDALVTVCDALGVIASDVLVLGRPEIGEVREVPAVGAGRSSTMPHKANPVLSVLVRSAALQAPQLAAQLHLCSSQSVDERPDGAWHAEWAAHRRLLALAAAAAEQAVDLVRSLEVDTERMRDRADGAAVALLAESGRAEQRDPAAYLGSTGAFIDEALRRFQARVAE